MDEGAKSGFSDSRSATAGELLAKRYEPERDCEPELLLRVSNPVEPFDVRESEILCCWSPSDLGLVPGDECSGGDADDEPAPMRLRTRVKSMSARAAQVWVVQPCFFLCVLRSLFRTVCWPFTLSYSA